MCICNTCTCACAAKSALRDIVPQSVACTLPHCDLRGQIKGTARTFTSFIVRSVRYGPYQTFNNKLLNNDILACVHPVMAS